MEAMKISEIMTPNPEVAMIDDPIIKVAKMMEDLNVGFMPIMDSDMLAGVVTDRDIVVRAVADGMDYNTSIAEIMTTPPQVISPDADVNEAASMMEDLQIRRLPVVDDAGKLVGIVSLGDVAVNLPDTEKVGEILEEISEPAQPERPEAAA